MRSRPGRWSDGRPRTPTPTGLFLSACQAGACVRLRPLRFFQLAADPEQKNRSQGGDDDLRDQAPGRTQSYKLNHETTHDPAGDPQKNVDDRSVAAGAPDAGRRPT